MRGGNLRYRSRTRWLLKWCATVGAVLTLVVTAASFWFTFFLHTPRGPAAVAMGTVWGAWGPNCWFWTWDIKVVPVASSKLVHEQLWPVWMPTPPVWGLSLPLWPFVVLPAALAAWLWWRDRQPPVGHCQKCGYNLTGNTSGRCPECGVAVSFSQVRRARIRLDAWPVNWLMFCYAVGGVAVHACIVTFRPYYGLTVPRRGDPGDVCGELTLVWTTLWALLFLLRPITKQVRASRRIIFIICMLPLGYGVVVTVLLLIRELASGPALPSEPLIFMPVGYAACLYPLFSGLLCAALLVFVDRMVSRPLGPRNVVSCPPST